MDSPALYEAEIVTVGEAERLAALEQVIEHGLQTFVDVGNALLEIRDSRLYRTTHGTFEDYCRERWGFTRMHAGRLIAAAEVVGNIGVTNWLQTPATESQARPLAALPADLQREAWQRAVDSAPDGKVTAAHVARVVMEYRMPRPDPALVQELRRKMEDDGRYVFTCPDCGDIFNQEVWHCPTCHHHWLDSRGYCGNCYGARPGAGPLHLHADNERRALPLAAANHAPSLDPDYDGDEWYTPAEYLDAVRAVLGAIDLDPATSEEAQAAVQARTYYTKQDNGLVAPWAGKVFMNPPYSTPLIQQFIDRAVQEYAAGSIQEAIILTNNSSETRWFQSLLRLCPVCFPASRLRFWRAGADVFGARQGQALFYMGPNGGRFREVFSQYGAVLRAI